MKIMQYNMEQDSAHKNVLLAERIYEYQTDGMHTSKNVAEFLRRCMRLDRQAEEKILLLALTSGMVPAGVFEIAHGTVNSAVLSPREIFSRLLLINAACFIIAHNHPSGDPSPSVEDESVTKRMNAASHIMGLPLMDHIIIGDGYYSFKDHGNIIT